MDASWTLLDLAGAVALLLWGVHMVQTGIQRAFGPDLHRMLRLAVRRRLGAFASGLGVTAVLQSSTATALMLTGLAAAGAVELAPALAVMLGANVGTTLIVQILAFNVAAIAPAFLVFGVLLFRRARQTRTRDLGRVAIGLALMLMALHLLLGVVTPFADMPGLRVLLAMIATQPLLDFLLAAVLTWAAHSSVAVILLVMSFAAKGVVPLAAAFALVLGANLGTAINPLLEGAPNDDPAARRLPLGNFLARLLGCVASLAALPWLTPLLTALESDPARALADFHTGFNFLLALFFLPLLTPYAALLRRLLPGRALEEDPSRPRYLDPVARENPSLALAGAAREALRMADTLEKMLASAAAALSGADRQLMSETRQQDDVIDRLHAAIKTYLDGLDPDSLTDADHRRLHEILVFASNIEAAADVLDHNLMAGAARRLKRGLAMGEAERAEASRLLDRLAATLRAAAAVFMTEDSRAARLLVAEKEIFRELETAATAAHFSPQRATAGPATALHLDALRDLKQMNAYLVAAAAYPVLQGQGELLPSRLRLDG